jgi:hypothetical protein
MVTPLNLNGCSIIIQELPVDVLYIYIQQDIYVQLILPT